MEITQKQFKEMLVTPGHVSDEQFLNVVAEATKNEVSLYEEIMAEHLISDKNLGRTIADFLTIISLICLKQQSSMNFWILFRKLLLGHRE